MKQRGILGATIMKYRSLRGIGVVELAASMRIGQATFYRRMVTDNFTADELRRAAKKLNIPKGELAI